MWGVLRAFFTAVFSALRTWRRDLERDALIEEGVKDDARITDQAAAIRIHDAADSVPRERTPDATGTKPERRGRRKPDREGAV